MRTIWLSLLLSAALTASIGQASAGETRARQILDRFEHANQWRDHVMVAAHRAGGMQAGKTLYPENSIAAVRRLDRHGRRNRRSRHQALEGRRVRRHA